MPALRPNRKLCASPNIAPPRFLDNRFGHTKAAGCCRSKRRANRSDTGGCEIRSAAGLRKIVEIELQLVGNVFDARRQTRLVRSQDRRSKDAQQ